MEKDWISIYSSNQAHKITMFMGILEKNDIQSVQVDKRDSSIQFGEVELCGRRIDVLKAKYLADKNIYE